jgi:hypothetical protein
MPLALQREPSKLTPEPDGAYPLSFPRLVPPLLDRNCVSCHQQKKNAPNLSGAPSRKNGWTQSYLSLAPYAWGLSGDNGIAFRNGMRSTPGKLGARASKLMKKLDSGHHNLKLSDEDRHRITLWLDCNSIFYGAYYDLKNQTIGKKVTPKLQ